MPEDYVVHTETLMQFDDDPEAALVLKVSRGEAQDKGWIITLVSQKV